MIISRLTHVALVGLCYGFLLESSNAFAPLGAVCRNLGETSPSSSLYMTKKKKSKKKKKLTSADIINRARAKVGLPVDEPEEPLFDDDLLDDMQAVLLNLEKRVKDGPGSLDAEDVTSFESKMERIVKDMKEKLAAGDLRDRKDPTAIPVKATTVPAPSTTSSTPKFKAPEPATIKPTHNPAPLYDDTPVPPVPKKKSPSKKPSSVIEDPDQTNAHELVDEFMKKQPPKIMDISNDEGPVYEGKGGLGIAKGTRSTYVIPGMEEMTPEEYRDALQRSVSERQRRRREMGIVGNQASGNYLDNLKRQD